MRNLFSICNITAIIVMSLLSACTHNEEGKVNNNFKFTIMVHGSNEINNSAVFIDSLRYVPLETDSNSVFGSIDKLSIFHDTIIILDKANQLLLTFQMNGKYLKRIGEQGRCPWCYTAIDDIAIDRKHDLILILDVRQKKILKYSLTGSYKGLDIIPNIFPVGFSHNKEYNIYAMRRSPSFYGKEPLYYDLLVAKNQKLVGYFPFDKSIRSGLTFKRNFYYYNDTVNYIRFREGEVYAITKAGVTGRFNIDFGENQLPEKYMQNGGSPEKNYARPYSYLFDRIVENNKYVYFSYMKKKSLLFGIYSKTEKQFYKLNPKEFSLTLFEPIYCYHNAFVSAIEPMRFLNFLKHGAKKSKDSILANLCRALKDYDNPVLVFHYTK